MSKVKSPNQEGHGFAWVLAIVLILAVALVGSIVWKNRGKAEETHLVDRAYEKVDIDAKLDGDVVTVSSSKTTDATPQVDLYEDYSCPHCGHLAVATDAQMKDAVQAGKLVVHIHPLHFLDRDNTSGHSHRALAAALAVADHGDTSLYWNYRAMLMEDMEKIYNKWSDDQFADAAKEMNAPDTVVEDIRKAAYLDRATQAGKDNAEKLKKETGKVSSPRVVKDGKDISGTDLENWVEIASQS